MISALSLQFKKEEMSIDLNRYI